MFKGLKFYHSHPFFFSLFPPLAMMALNTDFVALSGVYRSLIFSVCIALIIYLIVRLFVRKWDKASLIASLLVLIFFTFGHIYDLLKPAKLFSIEIGRLRFLLPAVLILAAGGIFLVLRTKKKLNGWNWFFSFTSILLVIFSIGQMISVNISSSQKSSEQNQVGAINTSSFTGTKRDVYYIVLDQYTRDDVLLNEYGLDTSQFISQLENMGFYVAKCSQNNYPTTALSMSATLNYEYLNDLAPDLIQKNRSWVNFTPYVHESRARKFFKDLGYKFVTTETDFDWVNIKDSDVFIKRNVVGGGLTLSSFETLFLKSTLLRPLFGITFPKNLSGVVTYEESHYEHVLYSIDQAKNIPNISGPKFVYLHLVVPHGPYVFTPDGEYKLTDEDDISGYLDNVRFIDNQIVPVLQTIIDKSETPPIIILQGDHGKEGDNSHQILNAYYLPDGGAEKLYPTITPVNSFRLIMDNYFGTNMGLLKDTTYTWDYEGVYDFGIFPNQCVR